jgi:hypothetical protein
MSGVIVTARGDQPIEEAGSTVELNTVPVGWNELLAW